MKKMLLNFLLLFATFAFSAPDVNLVGPKGELAPPYGDCVFSQSNGSSCNTSGDTCTSYDKGLCASFVEVQAGTFLMGSPRSEKGRHQNEKQHKVTLTKNFQIQTTEVTQYQWFKVMGNNPSRFSEYENCPETFIVERGVVLCPNHPVENVSWFDVQDFLKKLNQCQSECGGSVYRLPTEAEWEYATRGGHLVAKASGGQTNKPSGQSSTSTYSFGNNPCELGDYAWYLDNSDNQTHPVGSLKSNALGLYDVHGNVWEWVQDWHESYTLLRATDPLNWGKGLNRVIRGGSWYFNARDGRSAYRGFWRPGGRGSYVGFRLVKSAKK